MAPIFLTGKRSVRFTLTLSRLVTLIAFLGVFAMSARISIDNDTWWHLRAGQWMVENGALPRVDPFSFTRLGEPWEYPGWLVQVPLYLIYRLLGPGGLNLWTAAMVTLAMAFVWKTLAGGPFFKAFILILSGTVSGVYWAARPYLVTFLLAAVFLWILEDFKWRRSPQAERRLLWLPLLTVVWANSHGGFAVGFLLWGVYLAGEAAALIGRFLRSWLEGQRGLPAFQALGASLLRPPFSRLLLAGLLMLLAVCLNPFGPVMLAYPFKTVGIGALQDYIQEWQSPDFHSLNVQPFAWLLLLTLGAVGASGRRMALTDFLLVSGFFYLGLLAGRNIALFALVAPPVLARHLEPVVGALQKALGLHLDLDSPPNRRLARLNWILLGALLLAAAGKVALVFPAPVNQAASRKNLPVEAVEYLRQSRPPGRLFNSYNWGGYLLWALPGYPVFVDGRTDLYDDEIISQWFQVMRVEPGWEEVLERWEVRLVLLEPNAPVIHALESSGWQPLYEDELAVIYGR
jgi:hypothetical protein